MWWIFKCFWFIVKKAQGYGTQNKEWFPLLLTTLSRNPGCCWLLERCQQEDRHDSDKMTLVVIFYHGFVKENLWNFCFWWSARDRSASFSLLIRTKGLTHLLSPAIWVQKVKTVSLSKHTVECIWKWSCHHSGSLHFRGRQNEEFFPERKKIEFFFVLAEDMLMRSPGHAWLSSCCQ